MRHVHFPVWLGGLSRAGGASFIALFMFETLTRATIVTVLPLQALALTGDAAAVSTLYFSVGLVGLFGTLTVPLLVRRLRRRWVITLGLICAMVSVPLFAQQTLPTLIAGMLIQLYGLSCTAICLNLYVLDHIPRRSFTRFEPMRMLFSGGAWVIGPALGVFLGSRVAPWAPYAASGVFALIALGYFWFLRITESPVVAPATAPPPNPVRFVRRFFAQPRLMLAGRLAVGRSGWWVLVVIYPPIDAVTTGLGEAMGGILSSVGSMSLFVVTFWGWVGRRYGIRALLIWGNLATAALTVAIGLAAGMPWLGAAFLVAAAFAAGATDGAGNVPFLRAVRTRERPEMTTVFATYRDTSRLSIPGLYSLLLQAFALPVVFLASGVMMVCVAGLSHYIPRKLGREEQRALRANTAGR